jgi:hypothetical protein
VYRYKCPACGRCGSTDRKQCPGCSFLLRDVDLSESEQSVADSCGAMLGWILLGILYSLICLFLGQDFAGGGHGWLVPFAAALTICITGPATGVAWALRRTNTGWWIALSLIMFGALVDICLVALDLRDSGEHFKKGWEVAPQGVIIWSFFFLGHQLVALVIVLFYKYSTRV